MAGLTCIGLACAQAQDLAELELDHSVTSDVVTPHTDWATPYGPGPARVLFFVNGRGTNAREVIELKQRFDLDPQMVFWARIVDTTRDDWHGGENGVRRMARLLAQKWDAFVFIDVPPEKMPTEQQYALVSAVTEGAGLVLAGIDDARVLKERNRLAELPAFLGDVDGATAFTVKSGRGVRLPKAPTIAYRPGWEVDYDEWDMRLGKAVLWAARKEPAVALEMAAPGEDLPRTALPAAAAALRWQGAGAGTVATVTLRRDDGALLETRQVPLGGATGSLELGLPLVRAGRYWLDAVARQGQAVVAFASIRCAVVSERRVEPLVLDANWAEVGDRLSGSVKLSGPPGSDERLVVSLLDRRDRELVRQAVGVAAGSGTFAFEVLPWFPMLLEVRATLLAGNQEVASAWQFARVVKRHHGQFNTVMWDTPNGNLAPVAEESLARTGVTIQLRGGTPEPCVAAHDIAWIPYTTHLSANLDDQGITVPACWHDETAIQAHVEKIATSYIPARQHGVFVYSLGDEIDVRGSCRSPHCLAAYQAYLGEQYGEIAALNASWGTAFAGFADVALSSPEDNGEAQALREGNFPRWFDRQAFQSYSFCRLCERFGKAFRAIDPQSRCGFEGAGTFGQADDLDGFVRHNGFWSPYPGTADEVLRSIAPRDFPRSNWMGYTKDADSLLQKYWRMVTRGCDSVWWWRWEVIGRFHGWLAPSLDPYPAVREMLQDTQVVRDGLGDLLLRCELQTDGIGLLYSLPSAYAAKVQASTSFGSYERSHEAFQAAARELGLNFRYFTDRQMRLGEVDLGQFRAIILPLTQAMGAQEAEQLRSYVRAGGLLIADVLPAVYDGHVKRLAAGQLDDVFGVRRTGFDAAVTTPGQIAVPTADGAVATLTLDKPQVDGDIEAAGAMAMGAAGKAPLNLTNSFGKGHAVLLNLAMGSFPAQGQGAEPAAWLRQILGQRHVAPTLEMTDAKGSRVRNLEVTRWLTGSVQIATLLRHAGLAETVTLRLPEAMHVYDLKSHRDLGKGQSFNLAVTPCRAGVYALSPESLGPVRLEAAPAVAPGTTQAIRITAGLAQGLQAVSLRVTLPDGRPADWVDPVTIADAAGTTLTVPVALNDPPGTWTLTATDLYTGQAAVLRFEVRQEP